MTDDEYLAERMLRLVRAFPCLQFMPELGQKWDPALLAERLGVASSGQQVVMRFVLHVWDHSVWHFELFDLARLSADNLAVFAAWARDPWWA